MGSSSKQRTTFAKLNRESKLREKRADKEARKAARKLGTVGESGEVGFWPEEVGTQPADPDTSTPDGPDAGHDADVSG
jgi:hypothetical protein